MGTGSEPHHMPNPWKNAGVSVPVPFFHRFGPKKGTGAVGNAKHRCKIELDGASPHFRAPDLDTSNDRPRGEGHLVEGGLVRRLADLAHPPLAELETVAVGDGVGDAVDHAVGRRAGD